jgi:hypothetical protein
MIGLRDEVVDAVARDAITGEMTMNWKIGLLELDLSHWFSDDVTAAEETRTERTVVRLERKFW